jgi:MFS family permease
MEDRAVLFMLAVTFLQTLIAGAVSVFTVLIALERLAAGQAWVGYLEAASGIGALLGVAVAARVLAKGRLSTGTLAGLALWGLPLFLVAFVDARLAAVAAMVLIGIGDTSIDVSAITLLQRVVPEALLGRVFGLVETAQAAGLGLGALLAPVLVALFGTTAALVVVGALPLLGFAGVGLLRSLDERAVVDERPRALLRGLPIFRALPLPALDRLATSLHPVVVPADRTVFAQGDPGDRYYVVDEGRLDVLIDGEHVRELGPGDGFGEIALLRAVRRTATIVTLEPVRLLALDRAEFLAAIAGHSGASRAAEGVVSGHLGRRAPAVAIA